MGWLSDALNPVKHVKHMAKGVKALNKGDINRALDPASLLSKETPMEAEKRRAKEKLTAAVAAPTGRGMYMGQRGPTMFLGNGSSGGRQYTPNPFMASQTAQSMAPPQTGMAPPPQVQMPSQPMPMSSPKMPMPTPMSSPKVPMPMPTSSPKSPPQEAVIAALRNRGGAMR